MKPQYRMYVDESGDDYMKHFKNKNSDHLCLNGLILNLNDCESIKEDIDAIKVTYFNIDPDISNYPLHRREIINQTPPFDSLVDDTIRNNFNAELLELLKIWEFTSITVLIDKQKLKTKYTNPYNPYRFGFALLLERFLIFLKANDAEGDVMAESINKVHDKKLENVYNFLYNNDMPLLNFHHIEYQSNLSSCQLKMKKKTECICGLELTDLLVSALKRKIYKTSYPDRYSDDAFDEDILKVIESKILKKGSRENGIGLKVFP